MEYREFEAKSVDDCITEACRAYTVTSDQLDYEVVNEGSAGFLGMGAKPAVIKARVKEEEKTLAKETENEQDVKTNENKAQTKKRNRKRENLKPEDYEKAGKKAEAFLKSVFDAMNVKVELSIKTDEEQGTLDIDMKGDEMGVLIGKRGQTLDAMQYLTSLVANESSDEYVQIKLDTENYRERRKATLENLAKNISYKVKRTRHAVNLEPMNPYERRIIHAALQNDRYVTTHSEGEEPYRHVVVVPKHDNY